MNKVTRTINSNMNNEQEQEQDQGTQNNKPHRINNTELHNRENSTLPVSKPCVE
jgi:hypothetical protein